YLSILFYKKNSWRLWECGKPERSEATGRLSTFPWPEATIKPRRVPLEAVGALWESRMLFPTFPRTSMAGKGRGKFHFGKSAILKYAKPLSRMSPVTDIDQDVLLSPTFQERVWEGCGKPIER
ncbi:hypothetical protein ACFLQP_02855, partial [Acidobacteriota bacterium]